MKLKLGDNKRDALYVAAIWLGAAAVYWGLNGCGGALVMPQNTCEEPPAEHEGYSKVRCMYEVDKPREVCCHYTKPACDVLVCTQDCDEWVMTFKACRPEVE